MKEKQSSTIAKVLADFLVERQYEDIPKDTIAKVKHYIIDVIGCMVASSGEKQAAILKAVLDDEGGNQHSQRYYVG